jgi:hypothetical protein
MRAVAVMCIVPFLCVLDTRAQTFGPSYSLTSLTNGGDVLVGDKDFSNFFTSGDPYASNITVTGFIDGDGNYGLQFGGGFAANDNLMDFQIGYMVNVTNSANLIDGAALSFNGVVVGGGDGLAEVVEQVVTNMDMTNPYGQMSVYATPSSEVLSTNIAINPPQAYLNLEKDVLVDSFTITAYSSISTIDQSYMQIPEPSTIVLVGLGLFGGLAVLRRRCG